MRVYKFLNSWIDLDYILTIETPWLDDDCMGFSYVVPINMAFRDKPVSFRLRFDSKYDTEFRAFWEQYSQDPDYGQYRHRELAREFYEPRINKELQKLVDEWKNKPS